jgi:hypothetical protein
MKILHLVESYLPARNGMQVVTQLSTRLVEKGHQVTVVIYDERRNFEIIDGVRVIGFKINGNYSLGVKGEIENFQFLKRMNLI